ncbi:MAG: pyrroline-5-carboxylate reductase [Woeseiaceae bacterium]|nr:pyrroline-5-carboxylate reductase [Woeseiaceae bacterium]
MAACTLTTFSVAEPLAEQCERLRRELYGALVTDDNGRVATSADVLLFAVKPQILQAVCEELAPQVQERRPLIMSIAAGPRIDDIESWLGGGLCVVRVMPNQPALVDQGVSALIANSRADASQRELAEKIMTAVGQVVWLEDEDLIDGVTAISGTGPAYFYLLIDIMIEAGVRFGIDPQTARTLAVETARGASSLALAEQEPMKSLIDRVRSPGGTTTAAFEHLDAAGVRDIFAAAIDAARERAILLSGKASRR